MMFCYLFVGSAMTMSLILTLSGTSSRNTTPAEGRMKFIFRFHYVAIQMFISPFAFARIEFRAANKCPATAPLLGSVTRPRQRTQEEKFDD